jgi:hypothetical protein
MMLADPAQVEAKMRRALKAVTAPVRKVYVVNAPEEYSAPRFLRAAWGLPPFETVYISQFAGCESGDAPPTELAGRHLTVHVPDCAHILFRAIGGKTASGPPRPAAAGLSWRISFRVRQDRTSALRSAQFPGHQFR